MATFDYEVGSIQSPSVMEPRMSASRKVKGRTPAGVQHERTVLVLQGGGALGAYQAGVYEGMHEQGFAPDWVTGVSIGAINAALIAGNPPGERLERLREF
jgi:NTE family protein